jgi:threonine/homoserine/homoserine lactone efflux protein
LDLSLLARTFVLGFTVAAAIGPISLLVIRRTLTSGWPLGLASGLGVATADGIYGAVACFGLTAISSAMVAVSRPLALVGGAALVAIGLRSVRSSDSTTGRVAQAESDPSADPAESRSRLLGAWASTLGLTLANPMTVLLFAAIVVSLGIQVQPLDAAILTAGFALGSLTWWLILVSVVAVLRSRLSGRLLRWITVASGVGIVVFGVVAIVGALRP